MIQPDFWSNRGRYNQKKIDKEFRDLKRWLNAEAKHKRKLERELRLQVETEPKGKRKKGGKKT